MKTPAETTAAGSHGDAYYESLLKAGLRQQDVSVSSVGRNGRVATLSYTTIQTTQSGIAEEMGKVTGAYAYVVGDGWDTNTLHVTIRGADGSKIGSYQVKSKWARQYNNNQITAEQFSGKVLRTLRTTN